LTRRAYDIAGCTGPDVSVYLNDKRLPVKSFEDYMNLFIGGKSETKRVYQKINDRWSIGVCLSPDGEFRQISFVNGIFTDLGGRHVSHVVDNLCKKLIALFSEKSKKNKAVELRPDFIKKNLFVFINCAIENPSFDSQTKRELNTLVGKFGSRADIPDDFVEKVAKLGILEMAQRLADFRDKESLSKQMGGTAVRSGKITHPKLCDAGAPLKDRLKCTIVFTEGDSAANFMASGLKGIPDKEHQYWGYFPLRGKILNVRNATVKQLANNEEIKMIIKIMGLKEKVDYSKPGAPPIRYGRIMILADADDDGHHIKGLLMNFIAHYWPELVKREGFICDMATPICKAIKRDGRDKVTKAVEFYNLTEAKQWTVDNPNGWTMKYYKGLGTYTPQEAKDLCKAMQVMQYYFDEESSGAKFELAFAKKHENERKDWLNNGIVPHIYDKSDKRMSFSKFIDDRLKIFSMSDNIRSIPSMVDGFKPSQRKVIFGAFKRKLRQEIKVSQLAGYISEHSAYHHGEVSLHETMIGMARDYVGVNNINLMTPSGQFGSRLGGGPKLKKGDNSSAARYLHTNLAFITRLIFNEDDDALLTSKKDDGQDIEPEWYIPVIPMLLANGAMGIGTGYSSFCPSYNPADIIANIRAHLNGLPLTPMTPWYRGYNGKIIKLDDNRFLTVGNYIRKGKDTIRIRELPVGAKNCKSFTAYKEFLNMIVDENTQRTKAAKKEATAAAVAGEEREDDDEKDDITALVNLIDSYDVQKETDTDFIVDLKFKPGKLDEELGSNADYKFEKQLKLAFTFATSNIHAYDEKGIIQKYETPESIITAFSRVRLEYYQRRKDYLLNKYAGQLTKASSRFRFVTEIMDGTLDIYRKSRAVIEGLLEAGGYAKISADDSGAISYQYLLSMQISSFTEETLEVLKKKIDELDGTIRDLTGKTLNQLWLEELSKIEKEYVKMVETWLVENAIAIYK
jgi:DNA topoisomerase-2